jgi:hypothetical protein
MAFDTRATLSTWLISQLPSGVGGSAQTTIINEAIADAVGYVGNFAQDVARDTFCGDGITQRFVLTGADVELLDLDEQETPLGLATCTTLTAPAAVPTFTVLNSGGSIPAGVYYAAIAYTTTSGATTLYTASTALAGPIICTVGSSRITLNWTAPNTATDPTAGTQTYLSTGSSVTDVRVSSTTSGVTATVTISTLPATSAARPLNDYFAISTFGWRPRIEQDIGLDGTAVVDSAVMTLATIPARGNLFRAVYERKPTIPIANGDVIRVEQGLMRQAALVFALEKLSVNQESGDGTMLDLMRQNADAKLQQLETMASPRQHRRPGVVSSRS